MANEHRRSDRLSRAPSSPDLSGFPASGAALLLAACLLTGCSGRPDIDGPQVTRVPAGFGGTLTCTAARVPLPERKILRQRCWFDDVDNPRAYITITESAGGLDVSSAERAWDAYTHKWSYGGEEHDELEQLEVDGCPAWGWTTRLESKVVAYRLLVSGEAQCYAIEVETHDLALLQGDDPRAVALSFRRDRPGQVRDPVMGVAVLAAIVSGWWWTVRRRRLESAAEEARTAARMRADAARAARAAAARAAASGTAGDGPKPTT